MCFYGTLAINLGMVDEQNNRPARKGYGMSVHHRSLVRKNMIH